MKRKKENKINDPDVRLFAGLYRLIIYFAGVSIILFLIINTFTLGSAGYKTYKNWNNDKELKDYAIKINTNDDIYETIRVEDSKEEYLENVKDSTGKELAIKNYIKFIILEIYLIFLLLYYLNIFNFLTNDNLSNPFTESSDKYLSYSIKYGIVALACSLFLGHLGTITFETLLVLALIRYIIRKGTLKEA